MSSSDELFRAWQETYATDEELDLPLDQQLRIFRAYREWTSNLNVFDPYDEGSDPYEDDSDYLYSYEEENHSYD